MIMDKVIVSTDRIKDNFVKFLKLGDNERIIFSGKFGMGKSFFLNQFFNEKFTKEYLGIFITPVNYSVASNEDIFEYIKVDILMQLLEKVPCEFDNFEISKQVATYYYIQNNMFSWLGNILAIAEKVKYGTEFFPALIKVKKRIESFKQQNSENDKKEVFEYLEKMGHQRGSIYESDLITQIIQYLINEAKKSLGERKVVLIIDDLDRIDPEHIFRILNVLSAHDDFCMSRKHKFNVDQTILVCDIDNIRSIYHHKYGTNTDFTGYIDKFYSKQIFKFDIHTEFVDRLLKFLNPLIHEYTYNHYCKFDAIGVKIVCEELINHGEINLRHAHKIGKIEPLLNSYTINDVTISPYLSGLMLLNILAALFDEQGLDSIIEKYSTLNMMYSTRNDYMKLAGSLLEVCIKDSPDKDSNKGEYVIQNYKYTYSIDAGDNIRIEKVSMLTGNEVQLFPLWQIMKCANDVRRRYMATGVVR